MRHQLIPLFMRMVSNQWYWDDLIDWTSKQYLLSLCQQFRCINRARWNLSTSMDPVAVILSMSMHLTVLTANSALQLAYGFATDEIP